MYKFDFKPLSYIAKNMLLLVELKRLYFTYGKERIIVDTSNIGYEKKPNLGAKPKVLLKYKTEEECDPNNYNILDDELIYLG